MTSLQPPPQAPAPQPAGTFPNAWTVFRVQGVPVKIDRSWLLFVLAFVYIFFGRLEFSVPGAGTAELVVLSTAIALLVALSILAHELGHALTSLSRNIPVLSITLFLMGGITESTREAKRARDEFVIVGIGPFISLVLAAAFGLIATVGGGLPRVAVVAGNVAWVNLALAVFNIVPGYPLDGGRLLRSVLWGATGRPQQATQWAARVGQVFAALLIVSGALGFAGGGIWQVGAWAWAPGLWEVFIGFFLFRGATASHKRAQMRESLKQQSVRDVMGTVPPSLPADGSIRETLEQVQERPSLLWPVGEPTRGTLLMSSLTDVPVEQWETTRAADVVFSLEQSTVDVGTALDDALERMVNAPANMLVVTEHGRPVGLLTPDLVSGAAG